ncbi:helix-turn-helix transcriptional regulator [Amycolatopsis sp. NPDC006131]|uniref:PadR family transcriptional regulator n=1 Tax=Amycolatopsis sp. NPDC006131 TaxID=3156731 RepID=UPI0033B3E953
MRELIKERGKDRIANVAQRNSVYQTIDRLLRAELIAIRETERDERRPERTVYEITDAGRAALRDWTAEMLGRPAREFPEDEEYSIAVREAELKWVDRLLAALRSGELTWSEASIRAVAEKFA